jgi:hypothetical protein
MRDSSVAVFFFMVSAQAAPGVPTDLKFEVATLKHSPPLQLGDNGPFGIRSAPGGVPYQAGEALYGRRVAHDADQSPG